MAGSSRWTSARGAVLLAVVGGIVHASCFPPIGAWPLAFVAVTPLLVALRGQPPATAALLGWIQVTLAGAIVVAPWMVPAARHYFGLGVVAAALFAAGVVQVFGAVPTAAFAVAAARLWRLPQPSLRILAIAAAWTTAEWVRATIFTGAPWNLLGHALYAHPLWTQSADLGGVFLPSFVLAATGAAAAELVTGGRASWRAATATAGALLVATAGYGAVRLAVEDDARPPALRVGLVQGNLPNAWRSDVRHLDDALAALREPTRRLAQARPDLIVWPENAVSVLLEPNARLQEEVRDVLPGGPPLLLGAPRSAAAGDGRVSFFNSAFLISASGRILETYDKRRLVPFAEHSPAIRVPWLAWQFDGPGHLTPGGDPTIFTQPEALGVLICFEAVYPDLARDLVRAGARLLVNLSNDGWFGTSAELEQHFAMASFRAVETRRALVRATNTGVTALIGPSGRILARYPTDVRDAWVVEAPLRDGTSLYTRLGDLFVAAAALTTAAALLLTRRVP